VKNENEEVGSFPRAVHYYKFIILYVEVLQLGCRTQQLSSLVYTASTARLARLPLTCYCVLGYRRPGLQEPFLSNRRTGLAILKYTSITIMLATITSNTIYLQYELKYIG
jgi:hypothetical protein